MLLFMFSQSNVTDLLTYVTIVFTTKSLVQPNEVSGAASSDLCLNSAPFQYYYSAAPSYTLPDFCSPFNTSGGPSPDYSPTSPNYRQAFAIPVISNIMKRHYLCSDEPKFPLCSPSGSYSPTAPGYSPSSTGQANDKEDESTR